MVDVVVVVVVVQGWLLVGCIVVLVSNLTLSKGAPDMNTMINPELPQASREELLAQIESNLKRIAELEDTANGLRVTLQVADEHLKSWRRGKEDMKKAVEAIVHEHADNEGTSFFDQIVDLFDIELTKTVTVQYTVSVEVQATVPASMTTEEVEEELASAKLDYEFLGNGDIEIEAFDFGDLEVE
jgi:hypothetical protein